MKTKMHNGSRLLSLLLAVVLVFTLTVPALAAEKPQDMNLRIAVMSDLHYLSPDMIADTEDFEHAFNSDRKLLKESSSVLREMLERVRADKPDILLVSGDLTKDGEQECHAALAKQLQQLQQDVPGLKIYVINGNHDIRNYNAKNFNTADGKAVPATRTEPEDFKRIYDFVYSDPTVLATFTPAEGNKAGGLSYVARPVEGLTVIAMDTCRYSSDNTSNGDDEHETSGAISADLEKWVIEQTAAAKARGDLVIGLEHHGLVPHFDVQPTILPMYLVNGYERIAQEYADAGMSVVFTGHMHAVDIAAMTTKAGNTFYDIETGSALTYPCPVRFVDLRRSTVGGETNTYMSVSTKTHIGPIHYTDPATGVAYVIDDLTEYAREFGFTTAMLKTVAGDFVKSFFGKYLPNDTWPVTKIIANIDQIIDDVAAVPIAEGNNLLDFANWIYRCNLAGEDDGNYPAWVQSGIDQLKSGALLDQVLDIVAKDAFGRGSVLFTKFQGLFTKYLKSQLNDLLVKIVVSMSVDNNCPDDNDKTILLEGSNAQVRLLPVTGSSAATTQAYVQGDTATVFLTSRQLRAATGAQSGVAVAVDATDPAVGTVVLAGRSIANACDAGAAALQVKFRSGTVTLDARALAALDLHKDVAVSLASGASLNAAQQRALGSQAAAATLTNASVLVDGAAASCPAGSVRAAVAVNAADDLTAWSLADDGSISAVGGAYDAGQQTYAFDVVNGVTAIARFPFTDVVAGTWYYGAAAYAYNNGLFAGMTPTTFAPNATMTRAMLVSVLWRLAGAPAPKAPNTFVDVPDGAWYTDAVTWAAENGVVSGIGGSRFDPSGFVTREQTAEILYNYAHSKGYDVSARADLTAFPDAASVSGWAEEALSWANAAGLINGTVRDGQTILDPQGSASRAQVAMILMNYVEHVVNA
ncbi:MAG: S-layer homology domain-containing protein [Firmicutes bacterium]|nr:S-layer homology domain-containing protein [Bacillota bacterium]